MVIVCYCCFRYNTVDVSVLYEEGEDEEEGASKYSNRNLFQYEEYGELLRKYMAAILKQVC